MIKTVILRHCGNVVGAIRLSVMQICNRFRGCENPSQEDILDYFLCSWVFLDNIVRVFGEHRAPPDPEFCKFLRSYFTSSKAMEVSKEHQSTLEMLEKCGLLFQDADGRYDFTSALAKRFYFKKFFPNKPENTPNSLKDLVKDAIQRMSSLVFEKSIANEEDFPKEAVFQHEFMAGLHASLPPRCGICPELSRTFPDENKAQQIIGGEIDFFVNGDLRWGIELLVNGRGINEHLHRFEQVKGKYAALRSKEFYVVDFRRSRSGNPTNVTPFPNRITVFFRQGDFSKCICKFGLEHENYVLKLAP